MAIMVVTMSDSNVIKYDHQFHKHVILATTMEAQYKALA